MYDSGTTEDMKAKLSLQLSVYCLRRQRKGAVQQMLLTVTKHTHADSLRIEAAKWSVQVAFLCLLVLMKSVERAGAMVAQCTHRHTAG